MQTGLLGDSQGEAAPTPADPAREAALAVPEPPPAAPAVASAAPVAELETRIAGLETTLAEREVSLAGLGETLSARDATLAEMTGALAARDAELASLRSELDGLKLELADLRNRFAFDIQLASMKAGEPEAGADAAPLAADLVADGVERSLTSVQFDTGSARLSPGGQVHAAAAAVMLADMKLGSVRLVGFTDRTGSPARNRVLAEKRAQAVADFLIAQGVPAQLIETTGVSEGDLPVPTDNGVPEPLNRSVSILAMPLPTT